MFTAIHLGIAAPRLLHVTTRLLQYVGGIKPALEMPAAELAFLVLLVASPLPRLLGLYLVIRE
jgi:hypothetical protein